MNAECRQNRTNEPLTSSSNGRCKGDNGCRARVDLEAAVVLERGPDVVLDVHCVSQYHRAAWLHVEDA